MRIQSEIETVLHAHAAWREHFRDILNGRTKFDLDEISAADKCFFGNWLEHEGKRCVAPELHAEISAVHAEFHRVAADIIKKIKAKRFEEARTDIAPDGLLNTLSLRLKSLVVKIKFHSPATELEPASAPDQILPLQASDAPLQE